ncbi:HNH endonuclease, partial [Cryobacterium frigoriphilum]|uniref:HNH endonuclease n=1 Tax=Cryobacterium frigoriphilum TaxID=1259150 RepID=UPI00141AB89A
HIVPWEVVREHTFENMILLCAVDHLRYDLEKSITTLSVRNYKRNLSIVNHRYNDFERRVLEAFVDQGVDGTIELDFSSTVTISVRNLVQDRLVTVSSPPQMSVVRAAPGNSIRSVQRADGRHYVVPGSGVRVGGYDEYRLTELGKDFVEQWFGAGEIDAHG